MKYLNIGFYTGQQAFLLFFQRHDTSRVFLEEIITGVRSLSQDNKEYVLHYSDTWVHIFILVDKGRGGIGKVKIFWAIFWKYKKFQGINWGIYG